MKKPTANDLILFGGIFLGSGFIGASIGVSIFFGFHKMSIEAAASIGVAIGTLALAYFTWESVKKTNAVIQGEDRRHQQSYAPALVVQFITDKINNYQVTLRNKGIGPAKEISICFDGGWVKDGTRIDFDKEQKTIYQSFLATGREEYGISFIKLPPFPIENVAIDSLTIEYKDMFGNVYQTYYPFGMRTIENFIWIPPENLKIPGQEETWRTG